MAEKVVPEESSVNCFVCKETFTDPVSLSCNHSFCSSCLEKFWQKAKNQNCPICKRKSSKESVPNFTLKRQADSFAGRQKAGGSESEQGERKVGVVCSKHPEEPRLFCEDEQRPICSVCEYYQHQSHTVVSVERAVSGLKDQLQSDITSLQGKRDKLEQVAKTYDKIVEQSKKQVLSTERQIKDQFKRLHRFLEEEEESRLSALREEEQRKRKTVGEEVKKIQDQLSSLSNSISAVEAELKKDNLSFLGSYKDTQTAARGLSSAPDPLPISGALIDQAKHLGNLPFNIWTKMKDKVHFSPVVLDPNTAHPRLYLSDDLTSVRQGDTRQQLPDNPERHTKYPSVLGCEGFSSGTHSWEVEVGDHPRWNIGVAKESADRKGERSAKPKYGLWCLLYKDGKYTNGLCQTVPVKRGLQRIRVQLDYDGGEVSFYDTEDKSTIYTHKDTFTEKLFPYFNIGRAGEAKTADVKIHPAELK